MAMCQDDMDREIDTGYEDEELEYLEELRRDSLIADGPEFDDHVEACTNCGSYHDTPYGRCPTCRAEAMEE